MTNLANFALFQLGWFACVVLAARGHVWVGFGVTLALLVCHFAFVARGQSRHRELAYVVAVGLAGAAIDSALHSLGLLAYPGTLAAWPYPFVPPWIFALWLLFGTLPHHSLRWLAGRPSLAAVLGAVGGPLSFQAGARLGAVGVGEQPAWTWTALAIEYALLTPLMLIIATRVALPARSE